MHKASVKEAYICHTRKDRKDRKDREVHMVQCVCDSGLRDSAEMRVRRFSSESKINSEMFCLVSLPAFSFTAFLTRTTKTKI